MAQAIAEPRASAQILKSFHYSVVDEINAATAVTHLTVIGNILLKTRVEHNHPEILRAWRRKCNQLHYGINFAARVAESIEAQEQEIARVAMPRGESRF